MEVLWVLIIAQVTPLGVFALASHLAHRTYTRIGKWLYRKWKWFNVVFVICYFVWVGMLIKSFS